MPPGAAVWNRTRGPQGPAAPPRSDGRWANRVPPDIVAGRLAGGRRPRPHGPLAPDSMPTPRPTRLELFTRAAFALALALAVARLTFPDSSRNRPADAIGA